MKARIPLVLLVALAAFAIPAGSAFAAHAVAPSATFVRPTAGANISQNQTLSVDATNVPTAVGVDFYDITAGLPGGYLGGYSIHASDPTGPQGSLYSSNGNVDSYQLGVSGWTNGSYTIEAVLVDNTGTQISSATISESVTINNALTPLVPGVVNPLPGHPYTYAGTIHLGLQPIDQNNVITAGTFSVDGGVTTYPITNSGGGFWNVLVDTVALGVPNGDHDIRVHFADAAGNMSDTDLDYTIANPVAPTITPNTLVADKSLFRTDETQLEVGDIVQAYGMQAVGTPAPTIHYLWNICSGPNGQTCTGVTPGSDGSYTVQAADVGATLTLIATASNGVGSPDFKIVEFGVIAPAYVAPVDNSDGPQSGDAPQTDPAPTPAPVVTPPVVVVTPPVVVPPVATPPVVTPAEQTAIKVAQQVVQTKTAAVVTAQKAAKAADEAVKTVQKKVDALVDTVSAGTATPTEKNKLASTVATLVNVKAIASNRVDAAKAVTAKAVVAQKSSVQKVSVAQKAVVTAKTAVATGASTPVEKQVLAKTEITLVAAKAVVATKTNDVATLTKQLVVAKSAAAQSISLAQTHVTVALTAVASPTATSTDKETLIAVESKLAEARVIAALEQDALQASTTKLADAKQKLAGKKAAAVKP